MLVTLPLHQAETVNVLLAAEPCQGHSALLVGQPDDDTVALTKSLFPQVDVLPLATAQRVNEPFVSNRAWQATARHVHEKKLGPWLWLAAAPECPLSQAKLDAWDALYAERGKPFLGVQRNFRGHLHLDPMAVYPSNAILYSPAAAIATDEPFVLVAGKKFVQAAHLVKDFCAITEREEVSLREREDTNSPETPSILKQTPWSVGFYRFPDEGRVKGHLIEYFNPTIVRWNGALRLITRRRSELFKPGRNTLMAWTLIDDVPRHPHPIHIPSRLLRENWEDPRAIVTSDNRLLLSWCNFNHRSHPHQAYGIADSMGQVNPKHLVYGRNGANLLSNTGAEKNWCWFERNGQLYCDYMPAPEHVVLRVVENKVVETFRSDASKAQEHWRWGEIRGGSPPVLHEGLYWSFMHSRLPWKKLQGHQYNQYFMGVIAYDAEPPFTLRKISEKPILAGSPKDPRNDGAPIVVFPCGSVLEDDEWLVVLGVNDCRCAWLRIPHVELSKTLRSLECNCST